MALPSLSGISKMSMICKQLNGHITSYAHIMPLPCDNGLDTKYIEKDELLAAMHNCTDRLQANFLSLPKHFVI